MRTTHAVLGSLCLLLACGGAPAIAAGAGMTCDPIRPYRAGAPEWVQARRATLDRERLQRPARPPLPDWIAQRRAAYGPRARPPRPAWLEARRTQDDAPGRFGWMSNRLRAHITPQGGMIERRVTGGPPGASPADPAAPIFSYREWRPWRAVDGYRRGPTRPAPPPPRPYYPSSGRYASPWGWAPMAPFPPPAAARPTAPPPDQGAATGPTAAPPPDDYHAAPAPLAADSDGDGVPDLSDQCAATPAGLAVGVFGCPARTAGAGTSAVR